MQAPLKKVFGSSFAGSSRTFRYLLKCVLKHTSDGESWVWNQQQNTIFRASCCGAVQTVSEMHAYCIKTTCTAKQLQQNYRNGHCSAAGFGYMPKVLPPYIFGLLINTHLTVVPVTINTPICSGSIPLLRNALHICWKKNLLQVTTWKMFRIIP